MMVHSQVRKDDTKKQQLTPVPFHQWQDDGGNVECDTGASLHAMLVSIIEKVRAYIAYNDFLVDDVLARAAILAEEVAGNTHDNDRARP